MGLWAAVPRYFPALDRGQSAPCTGARGRPLRLPSWRFRRLADWRGWLKILIPCVLLLAVAFEMRTSWLQARLLSAVARRAPYSLKPGASHEYDIPYPLTYRHRAKDLLEVYTLLSGSHSEYRVPKSGGSPRLFQAREP